MVGIPFLVTVAYAIFDKQTRSTVFKVRFGWLFLAFALIGIFSALINSNLYGFGGGIFILLLCVFSMFARAYMTRQLFHLITEILCRMGVISFIIGAADFFIRYSSVSEHRTASTFFNANYYAYIIELIVLLCVYKLFCHPYKWRTYLVLATINASGIFFCKTRTAIPAMLIGLFVFFVFSKKYRAVAACLSAVFFIAVGMITMPETFILRYDSFLWSFTDRIAIWSTAFNWLHLRPIFGGGLWSYWQYWVMYGGQQALNAHNLILDCLLSFGIVGSSLIAAYFMRVFFMLKKQVHVNAFYNEYSIVIAMFFCTIAHCMTDLAIIGIEPAIMAMLLFGIVGDGRKLLV
jgi:O-antigen ligase